MDGQKMSHSKLTRTKSSLLRSSPTVRSSIHSFSSLVEEDPVTPPHHEEKPKPNQNRKMLNRTGPNTGSFNSTRFATGLASGSLLISSLLFFFFYFRREQILTSENLLLILIIIAISLFLVSKNRALIYHHVSVLKTLHNLNKNRFFSSKGSSKSVEWIIGDPETNPKPTKQPSFQNNKIIREGVEVYSNGDYYEGEFHKGKCSGSGVYNFMMNGRYEGDWVDGKYDGYGVESWSRGSRYKGQYRQGLRNGYGVYKFYTGDCYAGEWCNGQSHGIGVQSCKDGSCYVGEFKRGVKHGLGCYYFRNGDRYAGEYFGDKIHGFGVYHFANGHCYEGSWHEGQKQGYGMYTFRSGESRCGEWDSGSSKNSLPPLTDAVLRAVQAARKSAENAIHLHRVDEQVNKAVTAANRAATAARVAAVKAAPKPNGWQVL